MPWIPKIRFSLQSFYIILSQASLTLRYIQWRHLNFFIWNRFLQIKKQENGQKKKATTKSSKLKPAICTVQVNIKRKTVSVTELLVLNLVIWKKYLSFKPPALWTDAINFAEGPFLTFVFVTQNLWFFFKCSSVKKPLYLLMACVYLCAVVWLKCMIKNKSSCSPSSRKEIKERVSAVI